MCSQGFFGFTSDGCSPCECSQFASSNECNETGQCLCPGGVNGLKCDECIEGYYNISLNGCEECNCNTVASTSPICDLITGQCDCRGGAISRDCSQCPNRYFTTDGISRDYCVQCICSGQTDNCTIDNTTFALGSIQSDFTETCAQFPTDCSEGWELRTADGQLAAPYGPRYISECMCVKSSK